MKKDRSIGRWLDAEKIEYTEDLPLSGCTTFRIGGAADWFVRVADGERMERLVRFASREGIPLFLMGQGSNLLVRDGGIRGIVARMEGELSAYERCSERVLRAGGGTPLTGLCMLAKQQGLSGIEFAYGIPGSVGGGVFMNAGAYGGELCDVFRSAECLTPEGERVTVSAEEGKFRYRGSAFADLGLTVLSAEFELIPGEEATIHDRMKELMGRRKEKQPLEFPSAGSVFKRPEGAYAAALIEECGLKGYRIGGAEVSRKHSGFIINAGGATCRDVLALIEHVQRVVREQTGFMLEREVRIVGED
ncbi:MAG: UDP-N-acetylmuramate dehydrogenase [Oscillospiraceae bacterium]|nr:UDP-N-acetylmuramate dehydrogenase [Oscillospiraceae bacterium]